jgi:hypothetical protein
LKLNCDPIAFKFCLNFNLRRCITVPVERGLLIIGGLGSNGEFQNDVQRVEFF